MDEDLRDSEPEAYYVSSVKRRRVNHSAILISNPEDIYRVVKPLFRGQDRELFYGLYLNTKNHLLAVDLVSVGSLSASLVHPREVFKPALTYSAGSIVVAHNHPSGDPKPSKEDIEFTQRLYKAGNILGIKLLDHLVVSETDYESLRDLGHF